MDLVGVMLARALGQSGWAPVMGFGAGIVSSFGPCVAPRFVALARLTAGVAGWRRRVRIVAFVAGLCTSYVLLGTIAGAFAYANALSSYAYLVVGIALIAGGLVTIVRESPPECCPPNSALGARSSDAPIGAVFAAGVAFVAIGSPCCGPIAAMLAGGGGMAAGGAARSAVLLTAFALGHATPLVAASSGSACCAGLLRSRLPAPALSTVGGAVTIAVGTYYALLA